MESDIILVFARLALLAFGPVTFAVLLVSVLGAFLERLLSIRSEALQYILRSLTVAAVVLLLWFPLSELLIEETVQLYLSGTE
ncbi:hypothetical protein MRY87_00270 [bacterium]|nr:hypothetical protein [bacterium]